MNHNVLVVDDVGYILLLFKKGLPRHGYNPVTAQSAAEAKQALGSVVCGVAIVDIHLHGSDGMELMGWMKDHYPEIPVIAMSGKFSEDQIVAMKSLGVRDMVAKPVDISVMVQRIGHILEENSVPVVEAPDEPPAEAPTGKDAAPSADVPVVEPPADAARSEEDAAPPAEVPGEPPAGDAIHDAPVPPAGQHPAAAETPEKGDGSVQTGIAGKEVFVLDDDQVTLRFLDTVLSRLGYLPKTFHSPKEFLEHFKKDACSAAIVDIFFPGDFNGIDTIAELRRLSPGLPILVITGKPMADAITSCRNLGITEILVKPFDKNVLSERLTKLFGP